MTVQILKGGIITIPTSIDNSPRYYAGINGKLHLVVVPQNSVQLGLSINGVQGLLLNGNTLNGGAWYDFDGVEVFQGDEIQLYASSETQAYIRLYVKSVI